MEFTNLFQGGAPQGGEGVPADALSPVIVLSLAGLLVVVVVAGIFLWRLTRRRAQSAGVVEAEHRANAIIEAAAAEARTLRAELERERVKVLENDKRELQRVVEVYGDKLDRVLKELSYDIQKQHLDATKNFISALARVEDRVNESGSQAQESMRSFSAQAGGLFEVMAGEVDNVKKGIQHLAVALEEAAANESDKNLEIVRQEMRKIGSQTAASILEVAKGLDALLKKNLEEQFAAISTEVEGYRRARLALVDERILTLVSETAQIALGKQLSVEEHADLVLKALDEAKSSGVFV